MLVELAIGDAYGSAFEFVKPAVAASHGMTNDTKTYWKHPELPLGNGRYTDDTQMTMGIAQELCFGLSSYKGLTARALADQWVDTFKRDERTGYGSRFYGLLKEVRNGSELLERLKPDSARSGAAMRAGPIGLYGDYRMVLRQAKLQASITHNTPDGILASQAVAMMTHYFVFYRYGNSDGERSPPPVLLGEWLEKFVPGYAWSEDWKGWVSVMAIPCAHAAITAVKNGKSYRDVLERCISNGGDVDTVAAIAMFAASLTDLPNDLPQELYDGLENGEYGKRYLYGLDSHLKVFARTQGAQLF